MTETTARAQFQEELEHLERQTLGGIDMVGEALDRAIDHWVLSGGSDRPIYPAEAARIINALVQ